MVFSFLLLTGSVHSAASSFKSVDIHLPQEGASLENVESQMQRDAKSRESSAHTVSSKIMSFSKKFI